jgi:hypothetical protein
LKPLAAARTATPTICYFHGIPFVIFWGVDGDYSMGCEICVSKERDRVRRERKNFRKWGFYGTHNPASKKSLKCIAVDTSEQWPR